MMEFSDNKNKLALSKFERMLKSNKIVFFDSEEFEDIIFYYLDSGKINLAKKAIELSLNQHPSSVRLKVVKVELLLLEDKIKEAKKLLQYLETIEPTYDEIYIQKAVILSKENKHNESIEQLKIALKYTDDLVDVHHLLGMENLFIENFSQAKKHFKICLNLDNEDFSILYNVIYCYEINEEYNKAITFLNKFIDNNPYNEFAWHQLGMLYKKINKLNLAIRSFDYAILIDDNFSGAYFEKGKALEKNKEYKLAIDNYIICLELEDPSAVVFMQIANCYNNLNNYKIAAKYFLRAINEDPLLDYAWLELAKIHIKQNELQKALFYISKALEINDEDLEFLNTYIKINLKLSFYEEAIESFKKIINLEKDTLVTFLALSDVLHFIGEYKDAIDILHKAEKKYNNFSEILYRLSGLYFLVNNKNESFFYLENALKLNVEKLEIFEKLFQNILETDEFNNILKKFK